jgi:hypothetical protein
MNKAICFLVMSAFALTSCHRRDIKIILMNNKATGLSNVKIWYSGGALETPRIGAGEQQIFRIVPGAPSHLTLSYSDADGSQHEKDGDVYFEDGYKGTITVTIMPSGEVVCKDDMTLL